MILVRDTHQVALIPLAAYHSRNAFSMRSTENDKIESEEVVLHRLIITRLNAHQIVDLQHYRHQNAGEKENFNWMRLKRCIPQKSLYLEQIPNFNSLFSGRCWNVSLTGATDYLHDCIQIISWSHSGFSMLQSKGVHIYPELARISQSFLVLPRNELCSDPFDLWAQAF